MERRIPRSRLASTLFVALLGGVLASLIACSAPPSKPPRAPVPQLTKVDWVETEKDAKRLLQRLLKVDTTNPPGLEEKAARVLFRRFQTEGIEAEMLELSSGRSTVYAKLRGTEAEAKPILLLSHLDTVGADARSWPKDAGPFSAAEVDGAIWGRGALSGKGLATVHAMALIAMKRAATRPRRDVIFISTADGVRGARGIEQVIIHKPEVLSAELALGEGGLSVRNLLGDGRLVHAVATAEKGFADIVVTARADPPGQGFVTADQRLAIALQKIDRRRVRSRITAPMAETLDWVAHRSKFPGSVILANGVLTKIFELEDLEKHRVTRPMVTDTVAVTRLSAEGDGLLPPSRAQAYLRCEILPDIEPAALKQELRAAIDDARVHLNISVGEGASASVPNSRLFDIIERRVVDEQERDQMIAPVMAPWPTDLRRLRRQGVPAYGYAPFVVTEAEYHSIGGRDEKLSLVNLSRGLRQMFSIVLDLSEAPPSD